MDDRVRYAVAPFSEAFSGMAAEKHEHPSVRLDTVFARYDADLHEKAGGNGTEACSGDLLPQLLAACAGVTFNMVATVLGIGFRSAKVVVEVGTREGRWSSSTFLFTGACHSLSRIVVAPGATCEEAGVTMDSRVSGPSARERAGLEADDTFP